MQFTKRMVFIGTTKGFTKNEAHLETRNATFNYCDGEEDTNFKLYTSDAEVVKRIDFLKKFSEVDVTLNVGTYEDKVNVRLHDVRDPFEVVEERRKEEAPEQQVLKGLGDKSEVQKSLDKKMGV